VASVTATVVTGAAGVAASAAAVGCERDRHGATSIVLLV